MMSDGKIYGSFGFWKPTYNDTASCKAGWCSLHWYSNSVGSKTAVHSSYEARGPLSSAIFSHSAGYGPTGLVILGAG